MAYEDFVYFILSEEDKSSEPSLEYWYVYVLLFGNLEFSALSLLLFAHLRKEILSYHLLNV